MSSGPVARPVLFSESQQTGGRRKSTSRRVTPPRPCPTSHLAMPQFPPSLNGTMPRKALVRPHCTELWPFSALLLGQVTQRPSHTYTPQPQAPRQDTSMRFTMLRQDSRLKPLVRRSLSARKTSSSTLAQLVPGPGLRQTHLGGWDQGGTVPDSWHVKSSRISV